MLVPPVKLEYYGSETHAHFQFTCVSMCIAQAHKFTMVDFITTFVLFLICISLSSSIAGVCVPDTYVCASSDCSECGNRY